MIKNSFFVLLLLALSPFCANSATDPSDAVSSKESEDHLHLSGIGWETYLGIDINLATPIAGLDQLKEVIKHCLHHDGIATERGYTEERRYNHSPANTAIVRVFYQTEDGRIHHWTVPHVFISSWQEKDPFDISFFGEGYTPIYIGNLYRIVEGKTIRTAPAAEIFSLLGASIIDDFRARGIDILERKAGGAPKIMFSCDAYAHSEQAFVSYLQNDPRAIISHTDNPQSVILYIVSTRDPCSNCRIMMENFMHNLDVKKHLLKKLFPAFAERDIPVNIVYGSYMEFQKKRDPVDKDLIDAIDFNQWPHYILVRKNLRGGK